GEGPADPRRRARDHHDLVVHGLHAPTPSAEASRSATTGEASYASASKRASRRRKVYVVRGQSVVLRPSESRYHDEQPPVFQTVRFILRCRSAFQRRWSSARGSRAAYRWLRRVAIASRR